MKWNEPPESPPSWLDSQNEVTSENDTRPETWRNQPSSRLQAIFVTECFIALKKIGLSNWQAIELVSNAVTETGWGKYFRAWNLGGWKIRQADIAQARSAGRTLKWWRAPGNKAPGATLTDYKGGDPPWCYYRAFDSLEDFFKAWIVRFVPSTNTTKPDHRYYKTGMAFWNRQPEWFKELCLAGYKGSNTARNPSGSCAAHEDISDKSLLLLTQHFLGGLAVDGEWGMKSVTVCRLAQKKYGLPETGRPSLALLNMMSSDKQ